MSNIFISYAHLNEIWVAKLEKELGDLRDYRIWRDKNIPGGADWWDKILHEIQGCTYFIHVGTQEAYMSKFCRAELRYAFDLNKPIVPIILFPGRRPLASEDTKKRKISEREDKILLAIDEIFGEDRSNFHSKQRLEFFEETDDMAKIRLEMELALCQIRVDMAKGLYQAKQGIDRPHCPKEPPQMQVDRAEYFYNVENYPSARRLFKDAVDSNDLTQRSEKHALKRIKQIDLRIERDNAYSRIEELLERIDDIELAQTLWDDFQEKYPQKGDPNSVYDPQNLGKRIEDKPRQLHESYVTSIRETNQTSQVQTSPSSQISKEAQQEIMQTDSFINDDDE
jgi:tetratricopeptide (TPR) repeat protein